MANRAEVCCGNSGNYYLSIAGVKFMLWHLVSNFDFFCGKIGLDATPGPQNLTKKLAHVGVLSGHFLSQNRVPKLSDPGAALKSIPPHDLGKFSYPPLNILKLPTDYKYYFLSSYNTYYKSRYLFSLYY